MPAQLPDVLARVNGEAISKKDFEGAVQSAEQQAGTQVPPDQRDRIYRQILDQMIGYKLLLQESKIRKVDVPDADIEARILSLKQQFPTEDAFKQALAQRQMTVDQVKADARQSMAISKLVDGEIASKVAVKPEDVQAFYQQNPQNFKESEKVHASHILISAPKAADAATKAKARAKAESILKDVQAGKDFAALAKQNSEDPGSAANGGDLGFFQQGQMVPQFNEVAFSLKPGAVSNLVETDFGYPHHQGDRKAAGPDGADGGSEAAHRAVSRSAEPRETDDGVRQRPSGEGQDRSLHLNAMSSTWRIARCPRSRHSAARFISSGISCITRLKAER